jgi:hypothetical protein
VGFSRLGLGSGSGHSRLAGQVEDDLPRLVGYGFVFEEDGEVGVEELAGDVGKDGGAAGGDAAFGDEGEEAEEEFSGVGGGVELGEFWEEIGGEIFRVVLERGGNGNGDICLGVAAAKAGVRCNK